MRGKILWIKEIKQLREKSAVNLRRRLTVFLLLLTLTMLTGVMFLLAVFGVFRLGYGETEKLFEKELYHLTETAAAQYGGASAQAVRMSERLSESIADTLKRAGFSFAELKYHPELLESLLEEQVSVMLSSLDATGCSGVFLALDTTVNPGISGAENSKAGLYIRNTEPNFSGTGSETRLLLRGPSSLAVEGELNMQAEWDLEFGVKDRLFWSESAYAYTGYPALPLSRLVYWCCESPVPGLDEDVMICSVPLLSGGDEILGVCGFEISEMNFMLRHAPESGEFFNTVFIFSSMAGDGLKLEDALYSGNIAVYSALPDSGIMRAEEKSGGFMIYKMPDGRTFAGMEKTIRLYPDDSPFAGETFAASVVLPKADLDAAGNAARMRFVLILFVLMILGVFASVFLSKRYMKPIMDKLAETGGNGAAPEKTNITEFDLLLERFKAKNSTIPEDLFDDFIARVKTLTPTELVVFQAHADGKSTDEIVKSMYIALGTLKKHHTNIYKKLGVSSQEEMRLYISMLKKCGMMDRVFAEKL